MHTDNNNSVPFPASWAEVLPRSTVETAERLAETIYAPQQKNQNKPDGRRPSSAQSALSAAPSTPQSDARSAISSALQSAAQSAPQLSGTGDAAPAVFPPRGQVFRALELTPPANVRAVILGQDPYPTAGHASGLCFSVNPDVKPLPPSLRNIFAEYAACFDCPPPSCGDLTAWAERGVLLLNAVLTVEEGRPGSHRRRGWQSVTDAVLRACLRLPGPTVFLLWGRDAQSAYDRAAEEITGEGKTGEEKTGVGKKVDGKTWEGKHVLRSSHPSPLGARKPCGDSPPFLGSRPFLRANLLLGDCAIDWRLT